MTYMSLKPFQHILRQILFSKHYGFVISQDFYTRLRLPHPPLHRLVRMLIVEHGIQQFIGVGVATQRVAMFFEDEAFRHGVIQRGEQGSEIIPHVEQAD